MTITQQAHAKFGGAVSYRVLGGTHGIYAPTCPALWTLTASATAEELAAKVARMRPVQVQLDLERVWQSMERVSGREPRATARKRGVRRAVRYQREVV